MIYENLLNLVFPKFCEGCGSYGSYICEKCFSGLNLIDKQRCPGCRRQNPGAYFCNENCQKGFAFDRLIVAMNYQEEPLGKRLIYLLKYKFSSDLVEVLGKILLRSFAEFSHEFLDGSVFVAVPLHKKRLAYRGFNQSHLLAIDLAKSFHGIGISDCLLRLDNTEAQATLKRSERLANVRGVS